VSEPQEIEVEVVEIEQRVPAAADSAPPPPEQRPWRRMPQRVMTLPKWLLPLLVVGAVLFLVVAFILAVVIGIPYLIIRTILRQLR